jgi:hypothetical protein
VGAVVKGYEKKIGALMAAGLLRPGKVTQLDVRHDGACPKLRGGKCRCDPAVYLDGRPVEVPTA